jgi:predicted  nucleic acid-binding Zn-ribbon protein
MVPDVSNDKDLFRSLGLLSNEVIQVQKTLHSIDSHESRLKGALDELAQEKNILIEQTSRLETIVKQAATSAVLDAEQERERQQSLESEKSALQTQVEELKDRLENSEATVKDLQEEFTEFTAKIELLDEQIREKEDLLRVRDLVLTDLKGAAESLIRLVNGLSSSNALPAVSLDNSQDNPDETTDKTKQIEERTSMEIERLKSDIRERELALAAKSAEIEITRQKMGVRIEELEKALDARSKRKSARLVSFISDMRAKRSI